MPIDFSKLNDPEWRETERKAREAEAARLEAHDKVLNEAVDLCLLGHETLTEAERSLVRSCRTRLNTYLPLSEKQEKWLLDIAKRVRTERDKRIADLVTRYADGDMAGEHPAYPRSAWQVTSQDCLDTSYWGWVLFSLDLYGAEDLK